MPPGRVYGAWQLVRKGLVDLLNEVDGLNKALEECAETLASNRLADGIHQMCGILRRLPHDGLDETRLMVLQGCVQCLDEKDGDAVPLEYVLLALHALHRDAPVRNGTALGRASRNGGAPFGVTKDVCDTRS